MDSEHEKNLMNDAWRLFQLEKATGNPKHPFSKFGTGRKPPIIHSYVPPTHVGQQRVKDGPVGAGVGVSSFQVAVMLTVKQMQPSLFARAAFDFACGLNIGVF